MQLVNNVLPQFMPKHACLLSYASIPITNDINVTICKEHVLGLINNYIICMECKYKITYSSAKHEIIDNIRSNIYLAIKDSLNTKLVKYVQNVKKVNGTKLKKTFSPTSTP